MVGFSEIFIDSTKFVRKIKKSDYLDSGIYPIIDQGQEFVIGYTNDEKGLYNDVPAIIFGDHTRIIKYIDKPFFIGADGVKVLKTKIDDVDYKYLYYALRNIDIINTGYNRHFKWLKESKIKLPDIKKQQEIATILDSIENIVNLKNMQLQEYDQLIKSRFVEMFEYIDLSKKQSNWVKLGDITEIVTGTTPSTNDESNWGGEHLWITPAELDDNSFYVYNTERKLTEKGLRSKSLSKMPINTVLLSTRAPIGKTAIVGSSMACNQGFKNFVCKDTLDPIYLFILLKYNKEYLNSIGSGTTFKEISKTAVSNIEIPVPNIELQNKFAEFLKQVDKLKFEVQKSLNETQMLFDSLMQEYFG